MKNQETPKIKAIQLTGRDKSALWKTVDKGMILMADMDDGHIQRALLTVQQRQVRNLKMLELDIKLEAQLKQEAENRDLKVQDFDTISDDKNGKLYNEEKGLIKKLGAYIKSRRKENEKSIKELV